MQDTQYKIGIDLGGTKISAIVLDEQGEILTQRRITSPRGDYSATISTLKDLVSALENELQFKAVVGVGMPGSISPATGKVQNANSVWLNGKPFDQDLTTALSRSVRFANDADCFALSEAIDGAGKEATNVFGVIIGTGCGGGLVVNKKLIQGPRRIGGEWGHNPLPWPEQSEINITRCWCGQSGCIETWVSGPGFSDDHFRTTGQKLDAEEIVYHAHSGNAEAQHSLDRLAGRLARGLAGCVNFFDPDVIFLGGGLSKISYLYETLPKLITPFIFCDHNTIAIIPPVHGDDSGVRGAAWLWN